MSESLKPCRWEPCQGAARTDSLRAAIFPWRVKCRLCGATGPACITEAEAIESWNSRPGDSVMELAQKVADAMRAFDDGNAGMEQWAVLATECRALAAALPRVIESQGLDTPLDARQSLKVEDVQHTRFRPMSPTEAKSWGCDYGVVECESGGYPVTLVKL